MSENEFAKMVDGIEKKQEQEKNPKRNGVAKALPLILMVILGFLVGFSFQMVFIGDLNEQVSVPSECALRNTNEVMWNPSIITQSDGNNNVVGIPICLPFDRATGQRIKNA